MKIRGDNEKMCDVQTVEDLEKLAFRLLLEQAERDIACSRTVSSKELRESLSQLAKNDGELVTPDKREVSLDQQLSGEQLSVLQSTRTDHIFRQRLPGGD